MKGSVKTRWFRNIFLVTVFALFVLSLILVFSIYSRYNHIAEIILKSRDTEVTDTYFGNYADLSEDEFREVSLRFTESFEYRDKMDVWVIGKNGTPIASSGGYDVSEYTDIPDLYSALNYDSQSYIIKTKMPWGEPVMALTHLLINERGECFGALRYIVSMKEINNQFIINVFLILVSLILICVFVFLTGYYFVSSIVNPVKTINTTAKQIATGDFSARINVAEADGELGELCVTINDMAKQLGETERLKNEFISTVSHEIRTPLTAIKGWGETISSVNESNDELTKKGLDIIISETARLSAMVEELLDFSRIQNGGLKMSNGMVDILAEIQQAYYVYKPKVDKEGKFLYLDYKEDEEYFILGDSDKIYQTFINILDNSVKYTESGGLININVENKNNYVKIEFSDNGVGISAKDIMYVKDKFYKANQSKSGTGIGLAVADEIIKLHGGSISIYSEPGNGTTVEVNLPRFVKEVNNEQRKG